MTFEEIRQIPDLQIHPTPLEEDCFYFYLALEGRISEEKGQQAVDRIQPHVGDPEYKSAFLTADKMMENLKKYGVACADWI